MLQDITLQKIQSLELPDIMVMTKEAIQKKYEELIQHLQKEPECDSVELYYALNDKIKTMAEHTKRELNIKMYSASELPFLRTTDETGNTVITNIPRDIADWIVFVSYYRTKILHL